MQPRAHRRQHQNRPQVQSLTSAIIASLPVDIGPYQLQNLMAKGGLTVNVLQPAQDGDDFVAALQIQLDVHTGVQSNRCCVEIAFRILWLLEDDRVNS